MRAPLAPWLFAAAVAACGPGFAGKMVVGGLPPPRPLGPQSDAEQAREVALRMDPGQRCPAAARLRERAPALAREGRIDRAARALVWANALCPAEGAGSRALQAELEAELARADTSPADLAAQAARAQLAGDSVSAERLTDRAIATARRAGTRLAAEALRMDGAAVLDTSPDGRLVALVDGRGLAVVDVGAGRPILTQRPPLTEGSDGPTQVAFSPDGKTLAVRASLMADVAILDVRTGAVTARLPVPPREEFGFSDDGKLVTGQARPGRPPSPRAVRVVDGELVVIDGGTELLRRPLGWPPQLDTLGLSASGTALALGMRAGRVASLDLPRGTLAGHARVARPRGTGEAVSSAVASDDATVFAAVIDGSARVFGPGGTPIPVEVGDAQALAIDPAGRALLVTVPCGWRRVALPEGRVLASRGSTGPGDCVGVTGVSRDARKLIEQRSDGSSIVDLETGASIPIAPSVDGWVASPRGGTFAQGEGAALLDGATGQVRPLSPNDRLWILGFTPDESLVVGASAHMSAIRIWSTKTGGPWSTWAWEGAEAGATRGVSLVGARFFVTHGSSEVTFWSFETGRRLAAMTLGADAASGFVVTVNGYYDFVGEHAEGWITCTLGAVSLPPSVCEQRLRVRGLLARALRGDLSVQAP